MILQILSDLHLDFHYNYGKDFIRSIPKDCDVVIIAGDLCESKRVLSSLKMISDHLKEIPCIYVAGNHDFYGSKRSEMLFSIEKYTSENMDNIHFLENDHIDIDGVRFIGSTLWFEYLGQSNSDSMIADFSSIKDIYEFIPTAEETAIMYINNNMTDNSVIITHHLPLKQSVHPKFAGSEMNKYFLANNAYTIFNNNPKLAIHGHSHFKCDYVFKNTRVVNNAYGYIGYDHEPSFEPLYVEV